MKRAFTLIELLVVIAIIAILAAILFPVFAQAKEAAKKTQTLSNAKQMGTASAIYTTDYDDNLPLSMRFNTAANIWWNASYAAVPNGWTTSANRHLEPRKSEEGLFALNSMQPYMKNLNLFEGSGLRAVNSVAPANAGFQPPKIHLTYNGMLHGYSGTAVANVSKTPLFSGTHFKSNSNGLSIANPQLDCAGPDCRFNPGAPPSSAQFFGAPYGYAWFSQGGGTEVWTYGRGMVFVMVDSSARVMQQNAPIWPLYAENVNVSPWSSFSDNKGSAYWMTDCVSPGGNKTNAYYYPGFYRPDSEFDYTVAQCDFGGG